MKTIPEMLATVAAKHATRPAIVEAGSIVTYADLTKEVASLAGAFVEMGVRRGDRVAILLANGAGFVTSYFAAAALGAVVVPLNAHYQHLELVSFIQAADISLLVTVEESADLCRRAISESGIRCRLWLADTDRGTGAGASLRDLQSGIDPGAPVMYQHSSGSTGRPKRIARTHSQLLFELDALVRTLSITAEDRFLGVAPFSHVNGLMRSMMACLYAGATLYPLPSFERQGVTEAIEANRLSVFIGVPFMFSILAETNFRRTPDLSSLRVCVSASAPMPVKQNQAFHARFGMYVRQLYGSTETGTISVNIGENPGESLASVGTALPGITIDVWTDDGRPAAVGESGEVVVKSPAAIDSYADAAAANRESFRDGYFLTGDLGFLDARGCLSLVGRKTFFINKGGYKINPYDIESLLESHPKVQEAAVVGIATALGDEKVKAVIVANAPCTPDEIIEYCRGKIAAFKIPAVVEIRDSLPKSATGKVRKQLLRET